jgi:hypothetical protein
MRGSVWDAWKFEITQDLNAYVTEDTEALDDIIAKEVRADGQ